MNEEQCLSITSYAINPTYPSKQTFNGCTYNVHKHTHKRIHTVKQYKSHQTVQVQCYDLECQNNTSNH